jgi:hypothetical protein
MLLYMPGEHFEHLAVAMLLVKVPMGHMVQEEALVAGWK